MGHELRQDGGDEVAAAAIARCPTCGARVPAENPGCPAHGPLTRREGADRESSQVSFVELPAFPGYRTLRVIGRGGFGVVLAAEPEAGGEVVAIKVSRSDRAGARACLADEIQALSAVGPPHVPAVFASGLLGDGALYVVMEFIAAPTLAARLTERAGPTPLAEVGEIGRATLIALEAAHARGFVHRDLKPENVLVGREGPAASMTARLVDFGLAAATEAAEAAEAPAEVAAIGTAEYMSPEQCEGRRADARADVYAMGVILFELIAGRPPFWGPRATVQESHRERRPPRLSALLPVPARLEEVVLRCLAKDPGDRFAGAAELRRALESAIVDDDPADPAFTAAPMSDSSPRLSPIPALSPNGPSSSRERRRVALVFFEAESDTLGVRRELLSLGGQLAHAVGRRFVATYGHEVGENPARRSLRAAQELLRRGIATRALVDLAAVVVQHRADGSRRFLSPVFARDDHFPGDADPAGLFLTPAAAAELPEVSGAAIARGWIQVESVGAGPKLRGPAARAAPFVGRAPLLDALLASARLTIARGAPAIVRVVGEAGFGKSRLAAELCEGLRALDLRGSVITITAREPAFGGADRTIRDLLVQVLRVPSAVPPDGGRELLRERLGDTRAAEVGPILALALGFVPPDAPELRARGVAPSALRSALTVAAGEAIRRRAAAGPLFVVLDDAQFADDATLAALEHAALAEAGAPVWVCALGRPGFEAVRADFGERAARREQHRLEPLSPSSAAELCRALLRPVEDAPETAIRHLVERAQAIPLLLVELTRGLEREGLVRRHPRGDAWYLATDELDRLPDLPILEWLADEELDALGPKLRAHARLIALLGAEVSVPEMEGILRRLERDGGAAELPLDARVGAVRLLEAGVLVQRPNGRVAFRHRLAREAVARGAPEPMRRAVHLAAFEYYRDAVAIGEERRMVQIALHAGEAELGPIATAAHLALAERARARHAYVEAELLYSRAIERSAGSAVSAHRGRGLMRYRLGRHHDALADLARAREDAIAGGDVGAAIEILLDEATALDWVDEYRSSEARVDEARALVATVEPSPALAARLLLGIGRSLHRFSREDEAAAVLKRAAAEAERLGDEAYETLVIARMLLGFILQGLGRLDEARHALDRTIRLCEEHGDTLHLVGAINNRGLLLACLGDKEGMIADLLRVLALARELGQGTPELVGHYNLGEYLYLMDDLAAAEPHILRAVAIEAKRMGEAARPVVALLEARFRLYQGDLAAARVMVARIRARQDDARSAGHADRLMVPSEEVLCTMIELAVDDAEADAWDVLEADATRWSVGQEQIEVLEARGLAAARGGRGGEARSCLERAIAASRRIPNVMSDRLRRRLAETRRGAADEPP